MILDILAKFVCVFEMLLCLRLLACFSIHDTVEDLNEGKAAQWSWKYMECESHR